ncbi:mitochondrial arginine transporter BAC1 isoform X2 [Tripterygium wilfordii]|uniref:mitochondrial arginine transporter BAC1 isoform X2 n=1 Tax=Tripterygium wilfordii TaxID=458696 RepID=UPI0018F81BB6|nr:mitochondrial arginine transporter BAC1 isoform X2 [Tripterygium wilfordii]
MGEISGYGEYLAGLVAGVATVAIGHPFDTVKVKLQKHNTEAHGIKYRNGLHCTARILKTEGIRGLYTGATSSFIGVAFQSSIFFGIYSQTKQSLQVFIKGGLQSDKPLPKVIIPTAAFGGAIVSFVLCPSELVKCRMQVQRTDSLVPISRRYSSPLDCALQTLKSEGATGIFRGGLTTFLRESLGNAVFFSVYEYVRYYMHSQLKAASFEHSNLFDMGVGIVSGGLGGVAFWSAVLPLDVAKTIIQTSPDRSSTRNPFRAFPANAAAIVPWELSMKMLGIKHD